MGAVIPILILNYLTRPLGAPVAYVLAAMVPVTWVFLDLFFITRRFNFITSYTGLSAVVSGILAFWFVDGFWYAIKDSSGFILSVLVFGITVLIGRPILQFFLTQALNPDTPEKEQSLRRLLAESTVFRALVTGSLLVIVSNAACGIANFWLNYTMVLARFGTEEFNMQVAQVNAITRVALLLPSMVALGFAFWLVYKAMFKALPKEEGKSQIESDIWDLIRLREMQRQ